MKMNQELNELQTFTIEEFQSDFDTLMNRVEDGESFIIASEHGNAVIVPYREVVSVFEETNVDLEEIVKIHTDHEEGS
jgi:prevent-host-death family protein